MTADESFDRASAAVFAEASEWLVEVREGDLDTESRNRFHGWLRRSPEHIRAYLEIAALWGDIPKLAAGMEVDADAVVEQARAQSKLTLLNNRYGNDISAPTGGSMSGTALKRTAGRLAWVAAAAVAAGLCWSWLRPDIYETGIGEQRSITLTDGSSIDLGARSRVRVRLTRGERNVDLLAGEALFSVAQDSARPFVVTTGRTLVRAVGTQFDVHKQVTGVTVTVLEGRVAVLPQHSVSAPSAELSRGEADTMSGSTGPARLVPHLYVSAGEQVTVSVLHERSGTERTGSQLPSVHRIPTGASSAWSQRTLNFEDAPLSDVIEEFNRYNHQQLVLADPALATLRISGVFAANKPASLLRFLADEMHLEVAGSNEQVSISSPDKKKMSQQ